MYIPRLCPKPKEKQIKSNPCCSCLEAEGSGALEVWGLATMLWLNPTRLKEQQEARITVHASVCQNTWPHPPDKMELSPQKAMKVTCTH